MNTKFDLTYTKCSNEQDDRCYHHDNPMQANQDVGQNQNGCQKKQITKN